MVCNMLRGVSLCIPYLYQQKRLNVEKRLFVLTRYTPHNETFASGVILLVIIQTLLNFPATDFSIDCKHWTLLKNVIVTCDFWKGLKKNVPVCSLQDCSYSLATLLVGSVEPSRSQGSYMVVLGPLANIALLQDLLYVLATFYPIWYKRYLATASTLLKHSKKVLIA